MRAITPVVPFEAIGSTELESTALILVKRMPSALDPTALYRGPLEMPVGRFVMPAYKCRWCNGAMECRRRTRWTFSLFLIDNYDCSSDPWSESSNESQLSAGDVDVWHGRRYCQLEVPIWNSIDRLIRVLGHSKNTRIVVEAAKWPFRSQFFWSLAQGYHSLWFTGLSKTIWIREMFPKINY